MLNITYSGDGWISEMHRKIGRCRDKEKLQKYLQVVRDEKHISLSDYEMAKILMLEAYCNLKINLLNRLKLINH